MKTHLVLGLTLLLLFGFAQSQEKVPPVPNQTKGADQAKHNSENQTAAEDTKTQAHEESAKWTDVLLAWFTGLLVAVTAGLIAVGEMQRRQLKATVKAMRDDFAATHRPKIILREIKLDAPTGDGEARVRYTLSNAGQTTGTIIENLAKTEVGDAPKVAGGIHKPPPALTEERGEQITIPLKAGEAHTETIESTHWDAATRHGSDQILWCLGRITYTDGIGTKRATAFCCRYDPTIRGFRTLGGDKHLGYEYED
jgi:hypothetical protein